MFLYFCSTIFYYLLDFVETDCRDFIDSSALDDEEDDEDGFIGCDAASNAFLRAKRNLSATTAPLLVPSLLLTGFSIFE